MGWYIRWQFVSYIVSSRYGWYILLGGHLLAAMSDVVVYMVWPVFQIHFDCPSCCPYHVLLWQWKKHNTNNLQTCAWRWTAFLRVYYINIGLITADHQCFVCNLPRIDIPTTSFCIRLDTVISLYCIGLLQEYSFCWSEREMFSQPVVLFFLEEYFVRR